ncbi:uncharacterized protein THITE_2057735 [Thermothielavioides terrestris NRRL 8126]|uniref:Uncharacterized protein n=1 Tax=Thermothielavioides terrestris (strain ATCC 38088 / NRRL 8126) TaxID=578455 RepID=G2RD40_THETT|nr:uncharacterized protein THITE_2057735 [Thermothielavioides terrestris NRRL 8126]AEO70733.1 hypothetical protein THITE_2057735 [Thermothielavioides terrestris NRRL 8126]
MALAELHGRQDENDCTIHSTCDQCFGEGYIICDTMGCFNPDKHEQCCSEAYVCIGKDNSCCSAWGGPGITGTAGVPNVTAALTETAPAPTVSSWSCTRFDSGEACCQRAPIPLHWCSGDFPNQRCYNPENQFCCTDGTVCDEAGCCELFVR